MANPIKIKKGLDIPLSGKASGVAATADIRLFAITPDDFPGYTWKCMVKSGDIVREGFPLLSAKEDADLILPSPVAGKVEEIKRGERRKILYISVSKQENGEKEDFSEAKEAKTAEACLSFLKKTGLFSLIRQRPFDIVPDTNVPPRDIFITSFDTAPLAPELIDNDEAPFLEKGIEILSLLTTGKVYLSKRNGSPIASAKATVVEFEGPHPAGNPGTQIAAVKPVNKGETVWTLDSRTSVRIGRLFSEGLADYATSVAITGPEAENPGFVRTSIGASLAELLNNHIKRSETNVRIISGNVLTGYRATSDGFLRYPYRQITLIKEGDDADEFMGWASMNPMKYSVKHTFPAFLRGLSKPFDFDARIRGGRRAMILSGEYDKVFPFDIYPEYLIKAILAKDIDRMEKLGIYEVAPEDFALPEFVDSSKLELQKIVREGLDYLRRETV